MGESRSLRWHAPQGAKRSRLPRARTLLMACSVGLLLAFGLRGLMLGPGEALQRVFGRVRTHPSLLLQHYNARELMFRRDGKRVYFLHIHKVRHAAARFAGEPEPCGRAGCGKHAVPAGDECGRAGEPRQQLQPAGRAQARARVRQPGVAVCCVSVRRCGAFTRPRTALHEL